jgi:threonine dehydratase
MLNLNTLNETAEALFPYVIRTPMVRWLGPSAARMLGSNAQLWLKLELFQHTGTFKARGALANALTLGPERLAKGLTAASAGNHAIAVAWAAQTLGTRSKVAMQASASALRVRLAELHGAQVVICADGKAAFAEAERIQREEGLFFIHPFDSVRTSLGTATVGLECLQQVPDLQAVVVAVGGGGLAGGVAAAIKSINPQCLVLGVEPEGADAMRRSFDRGQPVTLDSVQTIADSLAPPMALPYSFGLCHQYLDDLVTLSDDQLCQAMVLMQEEAKLAVEPAAAAALAAVFGPYRLRLAGKKVGIIVCGANIDAELYGRYLARGVRP